MKIVKKYQLKIVIFTPLKNRCILHGRIFVMYTFLSRCMADQQSFFAAKIISKTKNLESLKIFKHRLE